MKKRHIQIEVQIMDQSYTLSCPEDGQTELMTAVDKVDETMCNIRDAGRIKSRDRITVLACLNIAHELCNPVPPPPDPSETARAERLASLIERLDQTLVNGAGH